MERMSEVSTFKEDYEVSDMLYQEEVHYYIQLISVQISCLCSFGEDGSRKDMHLEYGELQKGEGDLRQRLWC